MKRLCTKLIATILLACGFCTLSACNAESLGTLSAVAHPYAGTYECKYVLFNEQNLLDDFDYIRLELKNDDRFSVYFRDKNGVKGRYFGNYSYDTENNTFTIREKMFGRSLEKTFSVTEGVIDIAVQYGEKMLLVKFEQ